MIGADSAKIEPENKHEKLKNLLPAFPVTINLNKTFLLDTLRCLHFVGLIT